jgi:hypothetical protein
MDEILFSTYQLIIQKEFGGARGQRSEVRGQRSERISQRSTRVQKKIQLENPLDPKINISSSSYSLRA